MVIHDWYTDLTHIITREHILNFGSAVLILLLGIFLSRKVDTAVARLSQLDFQQRIIFTKIGRYGVLTLTFAAFLSQLGFDLKVLLGAAGVLTVAIGFAAQTSASNLISGIFLMIERPFVVGDIVEVSGTKGEVMAIDLLSCKIRTLNNLMVRIPNETMVKSNIVNISYFPVRRIDFPVGVGYSSNMGEVKNVMMAAAAKHPHCLDEPAPIFVFQGFGDSAMNVQLQVWVTAENVPTVTNDLFIAIKTSLDEAKIEIPFPVRTLLFEGEPTGPLARS